jgi:hypothetical protein
MKNILPICLRQGFLVLLVIFSLQRVQADLVAYWPLDDGPAGSQVTIADDVIDAGLTFTDATPNSIGNTWVFDATRSRVVLSTTEGNRLGAGTQGIDLNDGFTWSLWANVDSSNITDPGADVIVGTRNGAWNKIDLQGTSNWVNHSYPTLADNMWHHIAYVGDLSGVSLYIDGALISTDTTPTTTTVNVPFEIGGSNRFSEDITGLMSEVAIWNEALSVTRIQELASGGPVILIPEPSTVTLLLLGLSSLAVMRIRHR